MEAFKEGFKLALYNGCHFGISDELYILKLVFFSDYLIVASRDQFFGLYFSKVVKRVCVVEFKIVLDRTVFKDPF